MSSSFPQFSVDKIIFLDNSQYTAKPGAHSIIM